MAWWYHSGKLVLPIRWIHLRDMEGKLNSTALLCTDEALITLQIVTLFVRNLSIEVTL